MTTLTGAATGARPIGFRVGDRTFTYRYRDGDVSAEEGLDPAATAVVAMSEAGWAAVLDQTRTFVSLHLAGELTFETGDFSALVEWDPLLKMTHSGIPIYDPDRVDLRSVDLGRTFTLADSDPDMRQFLVTAGFLHVRGVFSAGEVAAMNGEIDRLAAMARPGDDRSWWVTDTEDRQHLCRLVYAGDRSPLITGIEADPRLARLGRLLDPGLRVAADRMEGTAVLIKVPGRTSGLSNIPWHQDCGMGGHAIFCPSIGVGIQLTGSNAATGNLLVLPASHGQTVHYDWQNRYPHAPVVSVDTEPGDVTVHVADVMHASPQPTGAGGRRTMYVTFYPPGLWDRIGPGQALNDLVRNRAADAEALKHSGTSR